MELKAAAGLLSSILFFSSLICFSGIFCAGCALLVERSFAELSYCLN